MLNFGRKGCVVSKLFPAKLCQHRLYIPDFILNIVRRMGGDWGIGWTPLMVPRSKMRCGMHRLFLELAESAREENDAND